MTSIEITQNFIENLEKVREELGWTQAQMAEKLQMSHSSYKYMISGKSAKIPIYVAYLVYQTTGKFFFELCGDIVPEMSLLMDYRATAQRASAGDPYLYCNGTRDRCPVTRGHHTGKGHAGGTPAALHHPWQYGRWHVLRYLQCGIF